jgi:ParD-like antitoxin of type II ParDE toxin-antitoxin system
MTLTVKLSAEFVEAAKIHSAAASRSIPKQIEYWARMGRAAEDNPDLPFNFIRDTLLGIEEARAGKLTPYRPPAPK